LLQGGQSRPVGRRYKRSFLFGSARGGVWRMLRVSRTWHACYGPCVHVWNMWTFETHLFNRAQAALTCRPGRTMDSPGLAAGTQCGGPKTPEWLTAGSAGCCWCGSWSEASRKEVASAAGCRLERSASPDRMNARSDVPCSIPRSVPGGGRSRLAPAAPGYGVARHLLPCGRRVRRRAAGHSGVRQRCRAVRGVRRHCRNRAAGRLLPVWPSARL
jgi:hypothetical protein